MNLAFSNIAWAPEEDEAALTCLLAHGINILEVAPMRLWKEIELAHAADALTTKAMLAEKGFSISGFQAILFGRPELELFNDKSRPALFSYLTHLTDLCAAVGGSYLVFGAPKNRWIPEGIDAEEAFEIAVSFLRKLGDYSFQRGVTIGIEANPATYGCNFCTTIQEVAALVRAVNAPGIRWHLDTGEMAMNHEIIPDVIHAHAALIGSIHISEPFLNGFEQPWSGHQLVAAALQQISFRGPLSIEMKRQSSGIQAINDAIMFVVQTYC